MITSDYHIVSRDLDSIDWSQCRLIMEINRQFFHYIIIQDNTVVALKFFRLTPSPERGIVECLEEIMENDELLHKNIKVASLAYNIPENLLVPGTLYDESLNRDMISLVHGDLSKDIILSEKIPNSEMYNIYQVPGQLHRFLDQKLSAVQYRHYYTLWIEWLQKQEEGNEDSVHVLFYPNELLVMLVKNGSVEMVQTFNYETTEDAGFHLLNVYYRHQLPTTDFPVKVSGMVATDSALYEELLKYFMLVETVPAPMALQLAEDFRLFPSHFFSPLLKMAVCV